MYEGIHPRPMPTTLWQSIDEEMEYLSEEEVRDRLAAFMYREQVRNFPHSYTNHTSLNVYPQSRNHITALLWPRPRRRSKNETRQPNPTNRPSSRNPSSSRKLNHSP